MEKVYIVAAKRTAIGKFLGSLATVPVSAFGATVVESILSETKVKASDVDEVIVGNVLMAGQLQGVARQISVNAGIPYEVPAYGVNMICGSGMKAVMNGFDSIRVGNAEIIIAGGAESMSGAGFIIPATIRNGTKMADFNVKDHMITDSLTDAFSNLHMGITAENIAKDLEIDREEQDALSIQSQERAINAIDNGKFKDEIVPIEVKFKKFSKIFEEDEFPNRETSLEKLSFLRPAFQNPGTVTAGNASGINDGAAFVMLASESAVKKYNLKPLVEIVAVGQGGVNPAKMGLGPVPAIKSALSRTELKLKDIELFELNEAFAAQALGVRQLLCQQHNVTPEWINERCNVNGGAIALGHPVGASGCRIIVTLIHEMLRSKKELGLASLCIGGGMGTAIIVKNTKLNIKCNMTKIKVGETYTQNVRYTQANVDMFAKISGDNNPIHIDADYAAKTPFGKPIVHGFFAGAIFSKVFGTQWPGEGTIYMFQDMAFLAPVFVENDYIAKFEVMEINEEKHRGVIKCTLEDLQGKVLISGQAKLMHKEKF